MIHILSDENVHADIVSGLRQEGFELVNAVSKIRFSLPLLGHMV